MSTARLQSTGELMTAVKHEFIATEPQLLEEERLLPTQFSDRRLISPEGRLLAAILEEALATYFRYADTTDRRAKRLFNEAKEWIFSTADWPLSFENICAALDIEPEYLRRGLAFPMALQRPRAVGRLRRTASRPTKIAHLRSL